MVSADAWLTLPARGSVSRNLNNEAIFSTSKGRLTLLTLYPGLFVKAPSRPS